MINNVTSLRPSSRTRHDSNMQAWARFLQQVKTGPML